MVTIYDIAKKCGVSGATVSKALNGHSDISEKTRKRVEAAADEMGYLPNVQARALTTKRSYCIGVVFVDGEYLHPLFADIMEHIRWELERHGYDMVFISRNLKGIRGGYVEHCRYRGVDGVILVSTDFSSDEVKRLVESEIPVTAVDAVLEGVTSIFSQNYEGTKMAVKYLARCGHQEIGFVNGGPATTNVTEERMRGFYDGMKEAGLKIEEKWIRPAAYYRSELTYQVVRELLSERKRPTALLIPDDYVALAVYQAAEEMGLKIPQDISFIGNDGLDLGGLMRPALTTIKQDTGGIGHAAARGIIRLAEHRNAEPEVIYIPTTIVERESVRKL